MTSQLVWSCGPDCWYEFVGKQTEHHLDDIGFIKTTESSQPFFSYQH